MRFIKLFSTSILLLITLVYPFGISIKKAFSYFKLNESNKQQYENNYKNCVAHTVPVLILYVAQLRQIYINLHVKLNCNGILHCTYFAKRHFHIKMHYTCLLAIPHHTQWAG